MAKNRCRWKSVYVLVQLAWLKINVGGNREGMRNFVQIGRGISLYHSSSGISSLCTALESMPKKIQTNILSYVHVKCTKLIALAPLIISQLVHQECIRKSTLLRTVYVSYF